MRIAIVGSRGYSALDAVRQYVRSLPTGTEIVSGGARGVDSAAETEARKCGFPVRIFHARWDIYGRSAGMMRNEVMLNNCDSVTAFWDGKSPGTKHMIECARRANIPVMVYKHNQGNARLNEKRRA